MFLGKARFERVAKPESTIVPGTSIESRPVVSASYTATYTAPQLVTSRMQRNSFYGYDPRFYPYGRGYWPAYKKPEKTFWGWLTGLFSKPAPKRNPLRTEYDFELLK